MSKLLIYYLALALDSVPPQIYWSPEIELKPNDFEIVDTTFIDSYTACVDIFAFHLGTEKGKMVFTINAVFVPTCATKNDTIPSDDPIIAQLLFDETEVAARKLRKKYSERSYSEEGLLEILDRECQSVMMETYTLFFEKCDLYYKKGNNRFMRNWQRKVRRELRMLDEHSDRIIRITRSY